MDSCIALKSLITGNFNLEGKNAREIKSFLLAVSSHLNKLSGNKEAINSIKKIINASLEEEAKKNEIISDDIKRDILILNSMINIDQQDLYLKAFEVYSKDENKEFPLPEQENVV